MKTPSGQAEVRGFTLIEFLVTIVVLGLIAIFLVPQLVTKEKKVSYDTACMAQQRQIGLELAVWKNDHQGRFPWQIVPANGAEQSFADGNVAALFQTLSNSAPGKASMLRCPGDRHTVAAANYAQLADQNISYFVAMDAGKSPASSILTGDRHLETNHKNISPGLFIYSTNILMRWTSALHGSDSGPAGVLAFYDGHAQVVHAANLDSVFQQVGLETNHLAVP